MSDTTESLRRKISSAGDLQSVVRTMKALAASSIGQYERSVRALSRLLPDGGAGAGRVLSGIRAGGRRGGPQSAIQRGCIGAIVFGSDQGLVGQFNDIVADYAIKTLAALPGKPSGRSASAFMRVSRTRACRRSDSSRCRTPFRPSPRSSDRFKLNMKRIGTGARIRLSGCSTTDRCPDALRTGWPAAVAARCAMAAKFGPNPLADRQLGRGLRQRHRDSARAGPRISFHLALPGLRRISGQRER